MNQKILCLVWAPFSSRMDELSHEIGGIRFNVTFLYGHKYLAPLRYSLLAIKTAYLLLKERPDVVYAQNPPVFCPLVCIPYCKIWKKKLVVDHHAVWSIKTFHGGILGRSIRRLEAFVSSHAYLNTAPHSLWADELKKLGANDVLVVYDYVESSNVQPDEDIRRKYSLKRTYLALAPHGGHPLERIESLVEAARHIDSMMLLLSGSESKLRARMEKIDFGDNERYLGFLERDEYEKLKASVDLGLSITDEPFTISHTLLEFASYSVPVISSNQAAVRELFGDSLLYVDSSEPSVVGKAIRTILGNPEDLKLYGEKIKAKHKAMAEIRKAQIEKLKFKLAMAH